MLDNNRKYPELTRRQTRSVALLLVFSSMFPLLLAGQEKRTFSGQVVWSSDIPASDVAVSLFDAGKELADTVTDTKGYFTVHGATSSSGSAVLVATAYHFHGGILLVDAATVTSTEPRSLTRIVLERNGKGSIVGTVTLNGEGIADIEVELRSQRHQQFIIRRAVSTEGGQFDLSGLPLDAYQIAAYYRGKNSQPQVIRLTSEISRVKLDIDLR
jgi:hypothetical protein